jgi:hypothetical protein
MRRRDYSTSWRALVPCLLIAILHPAASSGSPVLPCSSLASHPPDAHEAFLLCLADPTCAALYEQLPESDSDIFDYLLLHSAANATLAVAYDSLLCGRDVDGALEALAPLILVHWIALRPRCPPGYVFTGASVDSCICDARSPLCARPGGSWDAWLTTLLLCFGALVVVSAWILGTRRESVVGPP